jgi:glycosyltransferase involved in cell wall biosynthesis
MKVLILNNHFNTGGVTSYILNLKRGFQSLGLRAYVASAGGDSEGLLEDEHIKIPIKTKSELSYKIIKSFNSLCPQLKNMDLVHANTRVTQALARYINFKTGIPYITTWHGYHRLKIKHRLFPHWGERVIAVSDFVKNHLIEDFKIPPSKVKLIYNGIDLDSFSSYQNQGSEFLKELNIDKDSFLISALGRLSDVKGFDYLLEAFKLFYAKYPESVLILAGEGKERGPIEREIKRLGLENSVKLPGLVSDVRRILSVSDIFVQPSVMEGLGISILEALAMRVAVIATEVGGIPEIVKNEYNGLLVEPKSRKSLLAAMLRLKENTALRARLSENSLKSVARFSYADMAYKTHSLYREVKCKE